MRAPLVVVTARHYWKRIAWLYVGLAPFAALAVAQAMHDWDRGGERRDMAYAMLGIAAFMLLVPAVLLWARTRWVARFDEHGVTLRNGRTFQWRDFERVEAVKNRRLRIINHYDLVFKTGRAGVFYRMAANDSEVIDVLRALEAGTNPFAGGA
jgi:hypothetical protein